MSRRVLVTGASGYIGRQTLAPLLAAGCEVAAVARRFPEDPDLTALPVSWHALDLLAEGAAEALIAGLRPELCLHLAWDVSPGYWEADSNFLWATASDRLLRAFAAAGGRRFVGAGTCAQYDWRLAARPLREDAPAGDATFYGRAKSAVAALGTLLAHETGTSFAWGVVFFSHGPHEQPGRLVSGVARALARGEPASCSSGTQVRDFIDSRDLGRAFAELALSDLAGVVNLATGIGHSVAEVAETLGRLAGRPELIRLGALPDRPGDPPLLLADVTRLSGELGFRPRHGFEDGLANSLAWWRERR